MDLDTQVEKETENYMTISKRAFDHMDKKLLGQQICRAKEQLMQNIVLW